MEGGHLVEATWILKLLFHTGGSRVLSHTSLQHLLFSSRSVLTYELLPGLEMKLLKHQSRMCECHPSNVLSLASWWLGFVVSAVHMSKLDSWAGKCDPRPLTLVHIIFISLCVARQTSTAGEMWELDGFILCGVNPAVHLPEDACLWENNFVMKLWGCVFFFKMNILLKWWTNFT